MSQHKEIMPVSSNSFWLYIQYFSKFTNKNSRMYFLYSLKFNEIILLNIYIAIYLEKIKSSVVKIFIIFRLCSNHSQQTIALQQTNESNQRQHCRPLYTYTVSESASHPPVVVAWPSQKKMLKIKYNSDFNHLPPPIPNPVSKNVNQMSMFSTVWRHCQILWPQSL